MSAALVSAVPVASDVAAALLAAALLAAAMLGLGLPVTLTRLGLTDIPVCGSNTEVLHALGLDADGIAKVVIGCLDSK